MTPEIPKIVIDYLKLEIRVISQLIEYGIGV